jgi:fumarate reductase (CoM/CoB) subunit B
VAEEKKQCIHCGACTGNCDFLRKYQMDIGNEEKVKELAYHCFLCGKCGSVCPAGIDGREVFLQARRSLTAENGGKVAADGYDMLVKEKQNYIFRNYKNVTAGTVLFPGCNFPSFYPKTTKMLAALLKKKGIGTVYDCCGKPIAELGLAVQEERIIRQIDERLKKAGVEEVIMLCPNCYYFLKGKLSVRVTGIYEALERLGIGRRIEEDRMYLFTPCPDKESRLWQQQMRSFLPENVRVIDEIQCCGLGGCARGKEPEISAGFTEKLREKNYKNIYTYCGSCAGKFARDGMKNVHHMLVDILETGELPDTAKSMINRTMSKFW